MDASTDQRLDDLDFCMTTAFVNVSYYSWILPQEFSPGGDDSMEDFWNGSLPPLSFLAGCSPYERLTLLWVFGWAGPCASCLIIHGELPGWGDGGELVGEEVPWLVREGRASHGQSSRSATVFFTGHATAMNAIVLNAMAMQIGDPGSRAEEWQRGGIFPESVQASSVVRFSSFSSFTPPD